jgi:putative ATPase
VREHGAQLPPDPLRSAAYPAARKLGRGQGYDYPHDRPEHLSPQDSLPDGVRGTRFYDPDDAEPALRERLEAIRRRRGELE